jgi:hypothetical protein
MDFSQYLDQYLTIKRLQGITPSQGTSTALFSPYFDRSFDRNMTGRKLDLQEKAQTFSEQKAGEGLAWDKQKTIDALALQKWQNQLLMDQAEKNDTKATIGAGISSLGSLGGMYMMRNSPYWNRR